MLEFVLVFEVVSDGGFVLVFKAVSDVGVCVGVCGSQ